MKARAVTLGVALVFILGATATEVRAGSTATCTGFTGNFAGDQMGDSVRFGAQADFPASNSAYFSLCTGVSGADAFSSTWVALTGLNDANNIFQIGLDHCRGPFACTYPEDGNIHVFWAWGRTNGSPGCATQPTEEPRAQDLGVWDGSPTTFKVREVSSAGVQTFRAYKDGLQKAWIAASQLCWAGSHSIPSFYAESGDFGDATGGTDTQRYRISNASRQDTLGGAFVNTFFQSPCFITSYNYRCSVITTTSVDLWAVHP